MRRAGLLGMHAALSLLIALVVKLRISRSEAEMAAGGAGGVRRGGATGAPRARPLTGKVGCGRGGAFFFFVAIWGGFFLQHKRR